ncbi:MAG: PD40 domain-containing protein [Phycisphaerae bacterium]|nr:PD40 domain-containing protein [Gemmatimonadaceae bacterium]
MVSKLAVARAAHIAAGWCVLLSIGCGESPSTGVAPNLGPPGVRIVSGANVSDTATYIIPQPLVVEVRDDDGRLAVGTWVHFEVRGHGDATRPNESRLGLCTRPLNQCSFGFSAATLATAKTDSAGRASTYVQLGQVAGTAVVSIYAPEFGRPDSATFQVQPGPANRLRLVSTDTVLNIGTTANLRARVVDRFNNVRAELPVMSVSAGAAITLDAATGLTTARELGTQWVIARHGAFVDSTRVRAVPAGRLLVWSPSSESVRLVNINGTDTRTIMNSVKASPGTVPVFSATRHRVSFRHGYYDDCCTPNSVVVVDTTGFARRDVDPTFGFLPLTTRQVADGSVLIVGARNNTTGLWRFAADSTITLLASLPGGVAGFGAADISHDGTRVAYAVRMGTRLELRIFAVATNSFTVLEQNATSPRWSRQGDRVAFFVPESATSADYTKGYPAVVNADGSGRRVFNTTVWQFGIGWSPDGSYLIGRKDSLTERELQVLRVSDGIFVSLTFRGPAGNSVENYQQPDWR